MAKTASKVSAGQLISATVRYNNYDDANRTYDIEAEVNINGKKVQGYSNGNAKKHDATDSALSVAFNSWGENQLQINFQNASKTDASAVTSAVYDFMADVKAAVETTAESAEETASI